MGVKADNAAGQDIISPGNGLAAINGHPKPQHLTTWSTCICGVRTPELSQRAEWPSHNSSIGNSPCADQAAAHGQAASAERQHLTCAPACTRTWSQERSKCCHLPCIHQASPHVPTMQPHTSPKCTLFAKLRLSAGADRQSHDGYTLLRRLLARCH